MFSIAEIATFQRITSSGNIGDSGKAIDIVGYTIASGATAGVITVRNGTGAGSPVAWTDTALVVSQENAKALAFPVRLPAGCFVSLDGNVTACTVFYRQALS